VNTPPYFSAIKPGAKLAEQVADALEQEIRAGRMKPGEKLPSEATLVQQFAVSRTVVREAISGLRSRGLVDARQGSGVFVRSPGVEPLRFSVPSLAPHESVLQILEVRKALEAEVAELAAQRRSAQDIESIRSSLGAISQAVTQGRDGVEEDVRFHHAIAVASCNPFMTSTLDYLTQFLLGATRVTRANEARRLDFTRQVEEEHEAIVQAIEAGNSEAARAAAALHMKNAQGRIKAADPGFWQEDGGRLASDLRVPQGGAAATSGGIKNPVE
jgi:GntR family transcriptional regulator, transcriptional repressor for pyruvate dehydrogenase complex